MKQNRNLMIIALIAVVNALGYGIIIPILYSYSKKFGLSDFDNGLLFSLFSICQFISTPIIGRLSDKYGRKPLLLASISGTALSFILMAFAPNAAILFLARALDGITAGNIPVASAVISDTTDPKDRAKGFGIIGASFGFGFIFGPAITGLTAGWGQTTPFIIAAGISLLAVILTAWLLPETNKHLGEVKQGKIFDFKKLFQALFDPNVGITLLIAFFYAVSFSLFYFAFQPFSVKHLHLSVNQISIVFVLFGIMGLFVQMVLIGQLVKRFGAKKTFSGAFLVMGLAFIGMFFSGTVVPFIAASLFLGLANSLAQPVISTILSQETDEKSQGTIMGISYSYMSIGQIVGPILGGVLATFFLTAPFLAGSFMAFLCLYLSFKVLKSGVRKESAF